MPGNHLLDLLDVFSLADYDEHIPVLDKAPLPAKP
jgi:hypothetical protein